MSSRTFSRKIGGTTRLAGILAMLCLAVSGSAQTSVQTINLNYQINTFPPIPSSYDGVDFVVPSSSTPDWLGRNSLFWFSFSNPPEVIDWRDATGWFNAFQHTRFVSEDGAVRKAYIGVYRGLTPWPPAALVVEHFALQNVDMSTREMQLSLAGTSLSWTMVNSRFDARYNGSVYTPLFASDAPLSMTAQSGTSELFGWKGNIASRTALRVNPGATLRLKEAGDSQNPLPSLQLHFNYAAAAGSNTADIDNSTLELDRSGVIFETGQTPQITGGTVTEGFIVRNGGHLALTGSSGTGDGSRLEVRGSLRIDSSSLTLGLRNLLTVSRDLYLSNATVSLAADASIVSDATKISGTNTVVTTRANPPLGPGFRSAVLSLEDPSAVLNLTGTDESYAGNVFLFGGTLNLAMDPSLGGAVFVLEGDLTGVFGGTGQVNISPMNTLIIRQGGLDMNAFGGLAIHNDGSIKVDSAFSGSGTITGNGTVMVREGGVLEAKGPSPLALHDLTMEFGSRLDVRIKPSTLTASRIEANNILLDTFVPSFEPTLDMTLSDGDAALPVGTKFLLADYNSLAGNVNAPQFRGLPDGHVFQMGLNTYKIRYSDADYGASHGGNASVITLTVVAIPLLSARKTAGGDVSMLVTGPTGANFLIEASTDPSLPVWTTICTGVVPFPCVDTDSQFYTKRFYRAVFIP